MITLIVSIAIVGLIVWAITTFIPMPPQFKTAILVVALICIILYLLQAFGILGSAHDVPVPHLR